MSKNIKNNIKSIRKKALVILFLIMTLFNMAQPIFAISSSGSERWVAGQWDSEVFTTDSKNSVGMLMRRLTNYDTKEQITTFCAEHFVDSDTRSNSDRNSFGSYRSSYEKSM